jgi:acetyl-CoA synthetase
MTRRAAGNQQQAATALLCAVSLQLQVQVGHCLVYENKDALSAEDTPWTDGRDRWYGEEVAAQDTKADVEWVDAEDPLFLL